MSALIAWWARETVMAMLPRGCSTRPDRMLAAISPPMVMRPCDTRNTPHTMTMMPTDCCTRLVKFMASVDHTRIAELARAVDATASSQRRCMTPSAAAALMVSTPIRLSTSSPWRAEACAWLILMARASGTCMRSVATSTTGTANSGTQVKGPTISHRNARNTPMNRKSVTAMIACEVKKSRTVSNSRIWLATAPARPAAGRHVDAQRLLEELRRHLHVDPPAGSHRAPWCGAGAAPCRGTAPTPRRR